MVEYIAYMFAPQAWINLCLVAHMQRWVLIKPLIERHSQPFPGLRFSVFRYTRRKSSGVHPALFLSLFPVCDSRKRSRKFPGHCVYCSLRSPWSVPGSYKKSVSHRSLAAFNVIEQINWGKWLVRSVPDWLCWQLKQSSKSSRPVVFFSLISIPAEAFY